MSRVTPLLPQTREEWFELARKFGYSEAKLQRMWLQAQNARLQAENERLSGSEQGFFKREVER